MIVAMVQLERERAQIQANNKRKSKRKTEDCRKHALDLPVSFIKLTKIAMFFNSFSGREEKLIEHYCYYCAF